MIYFIITLLVISQAVTFYLLFNKVKPIIKPKGYFLKEIPNKPTYESLDTNFKLVYDVLESVNLEDWKVEVKPDDYSSLSQSWDIDIQSLTGIRIRAKIRANDDLIPYLSIFTIQNVGNGSISVDRDSKIENDIVTFLWDYIIEYYENENESKRLYIQSTIDNISSKLKTLRRSEKLNEILKL